MSRAQTDIRLSHGLLTTMRTLSGQNQWQGAGVQHKQALFGYTLTAGTCSETNWILIFLITRSRLKPGSHFRIFILSSLFKGLFEGSTLDVLTVSSLNTGRHLVLGGTIPLLQP